MAQITWKSLMTGTSGEGEDEEIELVQDDSAHAAAHERGSNGEQEEPTTTESAIPQRKDGGKWPSLYDECQHMLASSVMMYALTDLRDQIRKGKITDPSITQPFMSLPASSERLFPLVLQNKDLFNKLLGEEPKHAGENSRNIHLDLLMKTRELDADEDNFLPPQSRMILELHDENHDKEMVYSITLNHTREWIEITFRGSVTSKDFAVDADPFMNWYRNPVGSIQGHPQDKFIGIHAGFAFYMTQTSTDLHVGKTKRIVDSIKALHVHYPHYRVYLTGHSLGGALCTLTAFVLACTDGITKPVTCVSVASPKVGNNGFLRAFQALEKMGKIRCARVVNYLDLIPELPTRTCWCIDVCCCCFTFLCCGLLQTRRYWHVGVKILLFGDASCDIHYGREVLTYVEQMTNEASAKGTCCRLIKKLFMGGNCGKGQGDFLKNHSCKEYMERVDAVKEQLKARSMQEFYKRQSRRSINTIRGEPDVSLLRQTLTLDS